MVISDWIGSGQITCFDALSCFAYKIEETPIKDVACFYFAKLIKRVKQILDTVLQSHCVLDKIDLSILDIDY